jgi:hypothetical protein
MAWPAGQTRVVEPRIRLFGELDLRRGEEAAPPPDSGRVESLLAYLVVHRRAPAPRERLAFLLGPDSTERQARTNLWHVLHSLRRALPDPDRCDTRHGNYRVRVSDPAELTTPSRSVHRPDQPCQPQKQGRAGPRFPTPSLCGAHTAKTAGQTPERGGGSRSTTGTGWNRHPAASQRQARRALPRSTSNKRRGGASDTERLAAHRRQTVGARRTQPRDPASRTATRAPLSELVGRGADDEPPIGPAKCRFGTQGQCPRRHLDGL